MLRALLIFLLVTVLGSLCLNANAAKPVKKAKITVVHKALRLDSAVVVQRQFNAGALKLYKQDRNFKYITEETSSSFWDRFWRWFWNWLRNLFDVDGPKLEVPYVKYLMSALAIAIIVYGIIKYLGNDLRLFGKEAKPVDIPYSESLENIHEISFDEEIERAMAQHNYKLAVRLLYLRSLKQLNDAQLIHWQIEKTNTAYFNELTDSVQRQSFGILTTQFEYIWYGDFPVDGRSFQHIYSLFQDFKKQLP
jgi:hypothetical protein